MENARRTCIIWFVATIAVTSFIIPLTIFSSILSDDKNPVFICLWFIFGLFAALTIHYFIKYIYYKCQKNELIYVTIN